MRKSDSLRLPRVGHSSVFGFAERGESEHAQQPLFLQLRLGNPHNLRVQTECMA